MSSDTLPGLRIVGRRRLALEQEALREGAKCIKHLALTQQLGHSRNRWAALAARVFFNAWDILFCASYPPSWLRLDFSNWSLKSSATWKNVTDWWYFQQSAIVSSVTKSSLLTYKRLRSFGRCTADILLDWTTSQPVNQSIRQIFKFRALPQSPQGPLWPQIMWVLKQCSKQDTQGKAGEEPTVSYHREGICVL